MVKVKQSKSRISTLLCADGRVDNGDEEVKTEILNFYKTLLGDVDVGSNGGILAI